MLIFMMKRALPFLITLIVGALLGNIFGFQRTANRQECSNHFFAHKRTHRYVAAPLRILYQPETRYTPEARKNRATGVVKLLVRFDPDGTATVVERLTPLPYGLTDEAVRVAEQTRFIPATANNQPVAQTNEMNYIFSLSDDEMTEP